MSEYYKYEELGSELCCVGCEVVRIKDMLCDAVWNAGAHGYVLGVSGGLDSTVSLALTAKAVGENNVLAVFMPVSSNNPQDAVDAKDLCDKFGVTLITCPLSDAIAAIREIPHFSDTVLLTGNTASRLRMIILYNIASSHEYLVCGTVNKTEYMIGYSTKWGDFAADVQPLLHLYKKDVYTLARELKIPDFILNKAPSAGFFEGQTDEAEIGMSYAEIDAALIALEKNDGEPQNETEKKVLEMIARSRHKRMLAISLL